MPASVVIPEPAVELWREVSRLPPRQKTAVILRYIGGLTEAQVAHVMGVAAGTVAASLSTARSALRRVSALTRSPAMSLDQRFEDLAHIQLREPATIEGLSSLACRRARRRRARTAAVAFAVLAAVATSAVVWTAHHSDTGRSVEAGSGSTKPATTAVTASTAPSVTVLSPTASIRPPFTADGGALRVSAGDPPPHVSQQQAISLLRLLVPRTIGNETPDPIYAVVAGGVDLADGLGVGALHSVPAWTIRHEEIFPAACPAQAPGSPTPPPTASNMSAAVVTGPDLAHVVMYEGAGTYLCYPRLRPEAILGTDFHLQVEGR